MNKLYTLVMISKDNQLLLGMKKRGFGEGWWNGFGGKVEEGESVEDAARREVREEVGLEVVNLIPRGKLYFEFEGEDKTQEVYLFEGAEFTGEPLETDEMKPEWFNYSDVPYNKMWPGDDKWMPTYIEGRDINCTIRFSKDKKVLSYNLSEIKTN
jgi:8-oxo-dGTP diphosphatase/2-hydroxy-dATP diphosphatase